MRGDLDYGQSVLQARRRSETQSSGHAPGAQQPGARTRCLNVWVGGTLWDPALGVGIYSDGLLGPRVECAWLSGGRLGRAVSEAP